ncbi:hypothetical protein AYI69_g279 [Smittium culicis]|uniref:Uncharacterized protein n=1 Tax=Smittium culicis TaxID=133412 RepID=A0A1R1YTI0_9FUNG|nr:hypothetical protein AYI69_g279 [Smittium culicis]
MGGKNSPSSEKNNDSLREFKFPNNRAAYNKNNDARNDNISSNINNDSITSIDTISDINKEKKCIINEGNDTDTSGEHDRSVKSNYDIERNYTLVEPESRPSIDTIVNSKKHRFYVILAGWLIPLNLLVNGLMIADDFTVDTSSGKKVYHGNKYIYSDFLIQFFKINY